MTKELTCKVLLRYLDKEASLKWFIVGFALGIPAWIWGESKLVGFALKAASSFGWLVPIFLFASIALATTAKLAGNRVGRFAYGDFKNVLRWGHPKLLRATSVLLGVAITAIICWAVTGSNNALGTALHGLLLAGTLFYCWGCLAFIDDELSHRSQY